MTIVTYDENNIADDLHKAYEEGYRLRQVYEEGYQQGRIDEAKEWKNKVEQLRLEYENFKKDLEYYIDTTHFGKVKGESITTNKIDKIIKF